MCICVFGCITESQSQTITSTSTISLGSQIFLDKESASWQTLVHGVPRSLSSVLALHSCQEIQLCNLKQQVEKHSPDAGLCSCDIPCSGYRPQAFPSRSNPSPHNAHAKTTEACCTIQHLTTTGAQQYKGATPPFWIRQHAECKST